MSKDAVAIIYTKMLDDDRYRELVADDPGVLDAWDLDDEERAVVVEEATAEVSGFAIGRGPVMGYLSKGPLLSPGVASSLGVSLNHASGLPTGSLKGPGFASGAGCCPWGHPAVPNLGGSVQ
ncbi:MAG: hypothetical protein R2726_19140 [Acidimicrobiales bacterium]